VTDPAVQQNIRRSMIQVDVMRSFWQYRVIESHKENLQKVLAGILGTEEDTCVNAICDAVYSREEEAYAAENRKLKEKMDSLGVFYLTEGFDTRTRESFRFHLPVTHW